MGEEPSQNFDQQYDHGMGKSNKGGGLSIYERAAMNADPFSAPPNTGPAAPEERDAGGDRQPCQFCGRKFNETAAARHIPVCE